MEYFPTPPCSNCTVIHVNKTSFDIGREHHFDIKDPRSKAVIIAQATVLVILGIIIVLGNLACILTYIRSQFLRKRSNYLIVNLAVADLLVGFIDFMAVYYFIYYIEIENFMTVLGIGDIFTGIVSILGLASISVYRCVSILWPLKHRRMSTRTYASFIVFPWASASLVIIIGIMDCEVCEFINGYCYIAIPCLAVILILLSYAIIGFRIKKQSSRFRNRNSIRRDKKINFTLMIVTLASLVTWIPHQWYWSLASFCADCHFDVNVMFFMKFLQFSNSGLNIFIYIARMPDFKAAFVSLFCPKNRLFQNRVGVVHMATIPMATIYGANTILPSNIQPTLKCDQIVAAYRSNHCPSRYI